jgi:uncharacterized protein YcfJ
MEIDMKELTTTQVQMVSGGATNVEMCMAGTTVAGGVIGGVIGAYGTFGFGAGVGAGWGATGGSLLGTLYCSTFFA